MRARRAMGTAMGFVCLAGAGWLPSTSRSGAAPVAGGFELVVVDPTLVVTRAPGTQARPSLGVRVAAHDRTLEIWTRRRTYRSPRVSTLSIRRADGTRLKSVTLPGGLMGGLGLRPFGTVVVSSAGKRVATSTISWCPGYRLHGPFDENAAPDAVYPTSCSLHPFGVSQVNGIERGWASAVTTPLALPATLPDGVYEVEVTVSSRMASRLSMSSTARRVRYTLELVTTPVSPAGVGGATDADPTHADPTEAADLAATLVAHDLAAPPAPAPDPQTLPDIVPLPAYGMRTRNENGRDLLAFSANTWNRGPAPLVIEGYRIPGTELMDAHQIFHEPGGPESSILIGQMLFHHGIGHNHWHFTDFTRYDLTDHRKRVVATSGKQSWCLAPTDAIDLSVPNALWRPASTDLVSACGGLEAQWLRQVLPVGWGDSYQQFVADQAIDITGMPNGRFYVKVTVNPEGIMYEANTANNVSYRLVILGGKPGARTVSVPPYQNIDTD